MSRLALASAVLLGGRCGPLPAPAPRHVPVRIVSCSPSLTEIAFALGAGPRVVAVSDHCDHPPEVRALPRVGPFLSPRLEAILGARPDLVLLHGVQGDLDGALQRAGLRTMRIGVDRMADVRAAVEAVGVAVGRAPEAAALVARIERDLAAVRPAPPRSVLLIVGRDPGTLRNVFAAGPGTYLDELARRAGARNVVGDAATAYPRISTETIVARAPEVIVEALHPGADPDAARRDWSALATVPAVRDGRVHIVTDRLWVTPGPRLADGLRALVDLLAR
jgi:iron complex transport system substrate-binding protein